MYALWRLFSVTRDMDQGDSYKFRRVLCAYAIKYRDADYVLPADVVEAAQHLTQSELADLVVFGELRAEFERINQELENELASLDPTAKDILLAKARAADEAVEPIAKSMSLLERLLWGALTSASTGWDMYLAITGPDQSLLPRSSGYAISTISGAIGFLASPTANRMQFLETIFMDRAAFGTPHRSFYTAGSEHQSFYENKIPYLTGVSVAAATIVLGWTLPPAIKQKLDDRTMSKIGAQEVPAEQLILHNEMGEIAVAKAQRLQELQAKLERVSERWLQGDATDDQITRIRSRTNRLANLLLRATGKYVEQRHAEHLQKASYMGLWNATIGGILYSARQNLGQLGVLVPYIVHAQRCMWEIFFDFTQGAEAMRKLYVRLGAPIFYQLWCISVPLLKKGPHAFNDSKLKKQITSILVTINVTVIRHTPLIVDGVGAFGNWLIKRVWKPEELQAVTAVGIPAITGEEAEDAGDVDGNVEEMVTTVGTFPDAVVVVSRMLDDEKIGLYIGDGQHLPSVDDQGEDSYLMNFG